jgi:hypothetical protein
MARTKVRQSVGKSTEVAVPEVPSDSGAQNATSEPKEGSESES